MRIFRRTQVIAMKISRAIAARMSRGMKISTPTTAIAAMISSARTSPKGEGRRKVADRAPAGRDAGIRGSVG